MSLDKISALQTKLQEAGCDALLIEEPLHLFYLTGMDLSAGKIWIDSSDSDLIVDGRYIEWAEEHSPLPVTLDTAFNIKEVIEKKRIKTLAFESQYTSYQAFLDLTQKIAGSACSLIPLPSLVSELRLIKDPSEIQLLQQAAHLNREGYQHLLSLISVGISEEDLAIELEIFWKRHGGKQCAFDPIIAFGANSSKPHYRAGKTTLNQGESIQIDIGVVREHYNSDMSRVIFFGEPSEQIRTIYTIVEEAKNCALALCKPGTSISALDHAARSHIHSRGYGKYFTHSLGHGVGLEIHEAPTLRQQGPFAKMLLQPGMVITIEPGIYIPTLGGVRLEDTILITQNGYENLTA